MKPTASLKAVRIFLLRCFWRPVGNGCAYCRCWICAPLQSPDASRDGIEWAFKLPEGRTANAIDKALRGANHQAARVLIQVAEEFDRHTLEQAIHGRVRRAENILEVAVLLTDVLYHFNRNEILSNTFRGKMG